MNTTAIPALARALIHPNSRALVFTACQTLDLAMLLATHPLLAPQWSHGGGKGALVGITSSYYEAAKPPMTQPIARNRRVRLPYGAGKRLTDRGTTVP